MDEHAAHSTEKMKERLRDTVRWYRLGTLLSSLICMAGMLANMKMLNEQRTKPAVIQINPPLTAVDDAGNFCYAMANWASTDAYMTVKEAVGQPQALGMTEEEFRDAIIAGLVQGTKDNPVRTMHGMYNDWIIPKGFTAVKPGTKLPKPQLPPNP